MNAEMWPCTPLQVLGATLGRDVELMKFAYKSDPLLMANIGHRILGFMGFFPTTILSDTAYVWVYLTDHAASHKQAIARLARRWKPIIHTRYPKLVAHCSTSPEHLAWVRFIGGRTIGTDQGAVQFVIEDHS